ncbi:molybdopterin-dependent oxidoreductase [Ancylobacter oerskovii]|uniref:Molybdopterin-dependent oxidoreductase n=1 Tax=Ancylobacter oerskovii TaxID=459519 RepID=A0ABW4YY15_9HYPH|nr:molybdopterin-dependent oxidoreductase [Ancylobacter oerskovii]MBS7542017.1 molybdopterin-dependent oxidoreductase [Ancylobacter oerskovii]
MPPFLRRLRRAGCLAATLAMLSATAVPAQDLRLSAPEAGTRMLAPDALRALPAVTLETSFLTSRGEETGRFTGARLWDVLTAAGLVDPKDHHGIARSAVLVTARDGYAALLGLGELAPDLEAKAVLVAYERDGAALPEDRQPRLVIPGDRRGSRAVFAIARIDILKPESPK